MKRFRVLLAGLLLFLIGCAEPDIDKELQEFKDFSGIPAESPQSNLQNSPEESAKKSNTVKIKNGQWYSIASLRNHKEIERAIAIAALNVPEMGVWVEESLENGYPWKIWDNGGQNVPSRAWATTRTRFLDDKATTRTKASEDGAYEGVLTCDTYLDMGSIHKDRDSKGLGPNFLALILVHEASHCKYGHEAVGVWAEMQLRDRLGDERLNSPIKAHQDCLDLNKQWKEQCGYGS